MSEIRGQNLHHAHKAIGVAAGESGARRLARRGQSNKRILWISVGVVWHDSNCADTDFPQRFGLGNAASNGWATEAKPGGLLMLSRKEAAGAAVVGPVTPNVVRVLHASGLKINADG